MHNWMKVALSLGAVVVLIAFMALLRPQPAPQADVRNRLPVLQTYVEQASQSAADAKAAADQAAKAAKDIQASVDKLNGVQRNASGELKEGRPETTNPGTVLEFTTKGANGFTFAEKTGFVKQFVPLCDEQTVPGNKTVILNYHWKSAYEQRAGCYLIDGFSIVQ
jgi:hypothetical protein